jgi:hypothetical protein
LKLIVAVLFALHLALSRRKADEHHGVFVADVARVVQNAQRNRNGIPTSMINRFLGANVRAYPIADAKSRRNWDGYGAVRRTLV